MRILFYRSFDLFRAQREREREREYENVPFCSQTYRRVICNIPLHVYVASLKCRAAIKKGAFLSFYSLSLFRSKQIEFIENLTMFTTRMNTVHASSNASFRSGARSLKSAVFARRTWKKSMGSSSSSSSRGRMSVVEANQTASDEIEMLQKMLELAKRRKENESKEDLSVSAGGKSNGSGYEGTIKRRILEAIFESNRSFYIEDFSRGVA